MTTPNRPLTSEERLARLANRTAANRPASGPRSPAPGAQPAATRAPKSGGKRHAAKGSRNAALALSAVTTVGLAGWMQIDSAASSIAATGTISGTAASSGTASDTASAATATAADSSTATDSSGVATADSSGSSTGLADGTYTGSNSSTKWGDVQVQITVSSGVITDVTVLDYPANDNKSVQISQRSLPTLISETLTNQSASVDSVSGATYTSRAYKTSLQSAIDAAMSEASA